MPNGQDIYIQLPDGNYAQFPSGTSNAVMEKALSKYKQVEIPDASKQAQAKSKQLAEKTIAPVYGFVADPFSKDVTASARPGYSLKTSLEGKVSEVPVPGYGEYEEESGKFAGASAGAMATAPFAAGAKGLPWLIRLLARANLAGAGAGLGSMAGGASPKEALQTAATTTLLEPVGEAVVEGIGKTVKKGVGLAKDVAKPKVEILKEAHAAEARQAEMEYQKKLADHREEVQSIKAQHERAKTEFKTAEDLRQHQQDLAKTVSDNLRLADERIGQKIGGEFEKVSAAVEKKNPIVKVSETAEREARGKLFFPDSVKAFDNIMENFKLKTTDFSILRKQYTKLNEILYGGGELPTDLYNAVKTVRDAKRLDLQRAAESVGEGQRYKAAMKDWSDYQNDWHSSESAAKGGLPLQKILQAEDPQYVIDQLQGKSGQRIIEALKKYGKYGADSGLAQRARDFAARVKTLPKTAPEQPRIPAAPERSAIQPFDREAASREILVENLRKALKLGLLGGGGAYAYEKLLGNKPNVPVP